MWGKGNNIFGPSTVIAAAAAAVTVVGVEDVWGLDLWADALVPGLGVRELSSDDFPPINRCWTVAADAAAATANEEGLEELPPPPPPAGGGVPPSERTGDLFGVIEPDDFSDLTPTPPSPLDPRPCFFVSLLFFSSPGGKNKREIVMIGY